MKYLARIAAVFLATIVFQNAESAEFFQIPGTKSLLMLGEIIPSDVGEFGRFVVEKDINTIILRGPGGSLDSAFEIAKIIKSKFLNTTIAANSDCASSCSLVFVAGAARYMEDGSRAGFHLPFLDVAKISQVQEYCEQFKPKPNPTSLMLSALASGLSSLSGKCLTATYQTAFADYFRISSILKDSAVSDEIMKLMIEPPA